MKKHSMDIQFGMDTSWVSDLGMLKARTRFWSVSGDSSGHAMDTSEDLEAYRLISINPSSDFIKQKIETYLRIPVTPEILMP